VSNKYSVKNVVDFISLNSVNFNRKYLGFDFINSDFTELDESNMVQREHNSEYGDDEGEGDQEGGQGEQEGYYEDEMGSREGLIGGSGEHDDPMGPNGGTIKSEDNEENDEDGEEGEEDKGEVDNAGEGKVLTDEELELNHDEKNIEHLKDDL